MTKWLLTIDGVAINVDHVVAIQINDYEYDPSVNPRYGHIAVACLSDGKQIDLTQPCQKQYDEALTYTEVLLRAIFSASDNSIIRTFLSENESGEPEPAEHNPDIPDYWTVFVEHPNKEVAQ